MLEASERVGGRTRSHDLGDGRIIELGGQWAAPAHHRLLALADELGVDRFPTYDHGRLVLLLGEHRATVRHVPPLRFVPMLIDLLRSAFALERLARRLPVTAEAERALDARSLGDWLRAHVRSRAALELWTILSSLTLGGHPDDASLLFALRHIHGAGGLATLSRVTGGAQELRFSGGSQALALALADALGPRVVTGTPVTAIEQTGDRAVVTTAGRRLSARRVVVAMSPADAARIVVAPALPAARTVLQDELAMVSGFKIQAVYATPFWREDGLSGQSLSDRGPLAVTFDNTPERGGCGVLMGFASVDERAAVALPEALRDDPERRRQAIIAALVRAFGDRASAPLEIVEQEWGAEPWLTGCVPSSPPGLLTAVGDAARAPVGAIHWAGAEAAHAWDGYMEGAVTAAERAAAEVQAALA